MKTFLRLALLAVVSMPARAADDPYRLGDWLLLERRYSEAEVEYERAALSLAGKPEQAVAAEKMFSAAAAMDRDDVALRIGRQWAMSSEGRVRCLAAFSVDQTLYRMANYPAILGDSWPQDCGSIMNDRHSYVQGLSRLWLRRWSDAATLFQSLSHESTLADPARTAARRAPDGATISWKSPVLAASMSAAVPGAGYVYADRPQTGAAAFVVTGLFIAGTVSAARSGQIGLAAVGALFSLAWYSGAIYGSAHAADRENQRRLARFIHPLEIQWQ